MKPWRPEFAFVACLARISPTDDDVARARALAAGPLDWERVLHIATHHGVAPLVDAALARIEPAVAPSHTRARLRRARLESTRSDLGCYSSWLDLCRAFAEWGIEALTLKGFHVVRSVYREVGLRPVGDLDFLVRREDVPRALALLDDMGYALADDWQAALRHVGLAHILDSTTELGLASERGVVVDLHWAAGVRGTTPPGDALIALAERQRVDDVDVLVSPRAVAITLLLLHGRKDAWRRLRWVVDVAEWMEQLSPDEYAEVVRRLDGLRSRAALIDALQLFRSLWGRVPAVCGGDAGPAIPADRRALRYYQSVLERERDWGHLFDRWRPLRMLRDRVGVAASLGAGIASAVRPNQFDWAFIALPRRLRGAYYLVRPFRIVPQLLGRGRARWRRSATKPTRPLAPHDTPLTFVTAIYGSDPSSLLGGRGRDVACYLPSLINIANLGAPIVIYCPASDARRVEDAVAPHFHRYRVVPFELSQFEHYDRLLAWKPSYLPGLRINDRNEVLCFLKSYWVQQAIADNPFGHDRYFWIDAGLTHHGIFPERVGGVELQIEHPAARYFPRNAATLFTPRLGMALAKAVQPGKVTFCAMPFSPAAPRRERYETIAAECFGRPRDQVSIESHLVGGLFGGQRADLRVVHQRYAALLAALIASRTYTLEEQVFSATHAVFPELFALLRFDTWAFYAPGERTGVLQEEANSFYKIFRDLANA